MSLDDYLNEAERQLLLGRPGVKGVVGGASIGRLPSVHQNTDPMNGLCLDCGASREEIDDNIFPVCEKAEGPNRIAILASRREYYRRKGEIECLEHQLRYGEDAIV